MAFKTFARFSVQSTTVPQPLIGSWISAGIGAPSNSPLVLTLGTMTSGGAIQDANSVFTAGDDAWIVDPNGNNGEAVRISGVSGNTITLGPTTMVTSGGTSNPVTQKTHISGGYGTGSFILLAADVNNVYVTYEDGATGQWLYLGNQWNMTANYKRIAKLAKVGVNTMPYSYSAAESSPGNPFRTSELWTLGTNVGDFYNVTLCVA